MGNLESSRIRLVISAACLRSNAFFSPHIGFPLWRKTIAGVSRDVWLLAFGLVTVVVALGVDTAAVLMVVLQSAEFCESVR